MQNVNLAKKNHIREGSKTVDVIIYSIAIILALICLYPVYYVLILSLSTPRAAATMQVYWIPEGFYLGGYEKIFGCAVRVSRSMSFPTATPFCMQRLK